MITALCSHLGPGMEEKFSTASGQQHRMFQGCGTDSQVSLLPESQGRVCIPIRKWGEGEVCCKYIWTSPALKYAHPLIAYHLERDSPPVESHTHSCTHNTHTHTYAQAHTFAHIYVYTCEHTHHPNCHSSVAGLQKKRLGNRDLISVKEKL